MQTTQTCLNVLTQSLVWAGGLSVAVLLNVSPGFAEPVTYDYFVTVSQGPLAGNSFSGSFTYDDSILTGTGEETIGVEGGLTVHSTFFDFDYRETDDINYPNYPTLTFENGEIKRLDFWVEEGERIVWWDLPGWDVELSRRPVANTVGGVTPP